MGLRGLSGRISVLGVGGELRRKGEKKKTKRCNHQIACKYLGDGTFHIYLKSFKYEKIPAPYEKYNFCPDCGKDLTGG